MDLQHELDKAIRDKDSLECGYKAKNGKAYDRYMTNEAWANFLKEMKKDYKSHYKKYKDCKGGELKEKNTPPKMACFGSSSRFIYLLLRNIKGVTFEYELETRVGGDANLDAYLCKDNLDIFVEAKCREIYKAKKAKLKQQYIPVYEFIQEKVDAFGIDRDSDAFVYNGHRIACLDIKQLICHFLAISANYLTEPTAKANIRFVYFIYNPSELQGYTQHYKELELVYNAAIAEMEINIKNIFNAIFEYQKRNLTRRKCQRLIDRDVPIFEFILADQYNIKSLL